MKQFLPLYPGNEFRQRLFFIFTALCLLTKKITEKNQKTKKKKRFRSPSHKKKLKKRKKKHERERKSSYRRRPAQCIPLKTVKIPQNHSKSYSKTQAREKNTRNCRPAINGKTTHNTTVTGLWVGTTLAAAAAGLALPNVGHTELAIGCLPNGHTVSRLTFAALT